MASTNRSIYILGVGNVGRLVAHGLAASRSAPVVLLLYRQEQLNRWEEAGRRINLVTKGMPNVQSNFNYERTFEAQNSKASKIHNLVVATKTYATVEALRPIRDRLTPDSNVLFLQNGMGTVEEVKSAFFPEPADQPYCYTGIVTHGLFTHSDPFTTVRAGQGTVHIGPSSAYKPPSSSSNRFFSSFLSSNTLSTTLVCHKEITSIQLRKLAINATINSLSALLNRPNGDLLLSPLMLKLITHLLHSEIAPLLTALAKENGLTSEMVSGFSAAALEKAVLDAAVLTTENISSTLQDVRAGRKTEIGYINGYLVAQGSRLGFECPMNRKLVRLVGDGGLIGEDGIRDHFRPEIEAE